MTYHPPQRAVPAVCFTTSRWIRGTFHLPKLHGFDDHLRKATTFFPLTGVDLGEATLPFLAVRASAVHAVAPACRIEELLLSPIAGATRRAVSVYLEHLAVHGTLELLPGIRTSDYLGHHEGFIPLRGCRVVPGAPGLCAPLDIVFVNARAVIAVAEEEPEDAARAERAPADLVPA